MRRTQIGPGATGKHTANNNGNCRLEAIRAASHDVHSANSTLAVQPRRSLAWRAPRRPDARCRDGAAPDTLLAIATNAASLVRPGGTLVYAVCSLARVEGVGVAERLERALPRLTRVRETARPLPAADDDGVLRIGPWLGTGTASRPDGYQVVRWLCG